MSEQLYRRIVRTYGDENNREYYEPVEERNCESCTFTCEGCKHLETRVNNSQPCSGCSRLVRPDYYEVVSDC